MENRGAPASLARWLAASLGRADVAPVGADDVLELAAALEARHYEAGVEIFRRGELPQRVHILRSGEVELANDLLGQRVVLKRLQPGDAFGDIPVLLRQSEPFDAVTSRASNVLSIDSAQLVELLGRRPRLARRWLVSVADRMYSTQQRVADLLAGSLERQIGSFLLHQALDDAIEMSQADLARLLGSSRGSVNQALGRLERRELIDVGYRRVAVADRRALADFVSGSAAEAS